MISVINSLKRAFPNWPCEEAVILAWGKVFRQSIGMADQGLSQGFGMFGMENVKVSVGELICTKDLMRQGGG